MCVNYRPAPARLLAERFKAGLAADYKPEVWPGDFAPVIRALGADGRSAALARFGLVPYWARDLTIGKKTYNARSETVAEKPAYRNAWRNGQFCLVPMEAFYEPNWESGKAERWRIERTDRSAFAVAAIWSRWNNPLGGEELSFSMLTLNADSHPLMRRFHRPGDEKRMLAIVPVEDYDVWLNATPELARTFMTQYPAAQLAAAAAPLRPEKPARSRTLDLFE